jgi:hypothetical protein
MLRGNIGVARFTMFNRFIQMLDRFVQVRVFAPPLSMVPRLFRMFHERLSMTLFTMVHRFLRVRDGVPDVTGWGRLSVHHRHANKCSKRNDNEGTTEKLAGHLCLPFWVRIHS